MSANTPRTAKEALIAEVLGDLDRLLSKVEALPAQVQEVEAKLGATVNSLNAAGDRFRAAVTEFSDQARQGLAEHAQRSAVEAAKGGAEAARAAMLIAARDAFNTEASDKAAQLGVAFEKAAKEFRRSTWTRLMEHGITALCASVLTAILVVLFTR